MEANDLMLGDGRVGYLEQRDWNRARWAYEYANKFLPWLDMAGYVSFDADVGTVDTSASAGLGIPATSLMADEIRRLIREIDRWPYLETAARDIFGASLMLDLGREMTTAVHRWPMEDKPRKIVDLRCGGCGQLTLIYRPPRWEGDDLKADCSERCGFELVGEELALSIEMVLEEEKVRRKEAKKGQRSA